MTKQEQLKKFKEIYNKTYEDCMAMLKKSKRCCVIRPTGFGKTVMMADIINSGEYENVLYIYPYNSVKNAAIRHIKEDRIDNVDFLTYYALGLCKHDMKKLTGILDKYNLIVFDEVHHIGSDNVKEVVESIIPMVIKYSITLVGATATPVRMDGYDLVNDVFDNCVLSFYGLNSAISDGIIEKLHYVYSLDSSKTVIKRKFDERNLTKEQIASLIKSNKDFKDDILEITKISNAASIINSNIAKAYDGVLPNYMRFIVYFPTIKVLRTRLNEIWDWFKKAFPTYDVEYPLCIFSGGEEHKNIDLLEKMEYKQNTVHLVFCVDMLNEGYHFEDTTAVVLLRTTQSQIVYTQQIGRCIQVCSENPPIVFDFVGNINLGLLYNLDMKPQGQQPKQVKSEDVYEVIEADNIIFIDNVADVRDIIAKIDEYLPGNEAALILEYRKNYSMPAAALAKHFKIPQWKILNILDMYKDELEPMGLARCERDESTSLVG